MDRLDKNELKDWYLKFPYYKEHLPTFEVRLLLGRGSSGNNFLPLGNSHLAGFSEWNQADTEAN